MPRFIALFVFISIQIGAFALEAASIQQKAPTNFHQISPGLYRGARPDADNLRYLKSLGVKTIINLQGGDAKDPVFGWIARLIEVGESPAWIRYEKNVAESLGMRFIHAPLNSLDKVTPEQGYSIGAVIHFMSDPQNQPLYVHCEHGKDRTGMVVALYRVYYENWPPQKAHDEMVARGHGMLNSLITSDMDDFFWAAANDK